MTLLAAAKRLRRGSATLTPISPKVLRSDRPIVSFTFDDFPKSAWINAGPALACAGFQGTFYTAADLMGRSHKDLGAFCDADDIAGLIENGHEIGCHTRSHLDCQTASRSEIADDMASNRTYFKQQFGQDLQSFAYPYGVVTHGAKLAAAASYACSRGIRPGLNGRVVDASQLRAIAVYTPLSTKRIQAVIQEAIAKKAWLIFYTHDVQKSPSHVGCTPEDFEAVVKMTADSGCEVMTVRQAYEAARSTESERISA